MRSTSEYYNNLLLLLCLWCISIVTFVFVYDCFYSLFSFTLHTETKPIPLFILLDSYMLTNYWPQYHFNVPTPIILNKSHSQSHSFFYSLSLPICHSFFFFVLYSNTIVPSCVWLWFCFLFFTETNTIVRFIVWQLFFLYFFKIKFDNGVAFFKFLSKRSEKNTVNF